MSIDNKDEVISNPMREFVAWLNTLSDADPTKRRAVRASITYDHKLGMFRVYLGPRDPMVMTDLAGVKRILEKGTHNT